MEIGCRPLLIRRAWRKLLKHFLHALIRILGVLAMEIVAYARNDQLSHAEVKRGSLHSRARSNATRTGDNPAGLLADPQNVVPLRVPKSRAACPSEVNGTWTYLSSRYLKPRSRQLPERAGRFAAAARPLRNKFGSLLPPRATNKPSGSSLYASCVFASLFLSAFFLAQM